MQASEAAELLAFIAAFDNRKVSKEAAVAWSMTVNREVPQLTLPVAREIVMDHFASQGPYFTVGALLDEARLRLRLDSRAIAADVRSARARGLVYSDWPTSKALPADVVDRLAAARKGEIDEMAALGGFDDAPNVSPLKLEAGRRIE